MTALIPQLPDVINEIVVAYFDNHYPQTPCCANTYQEFHEEPCHCPNEQYEDLFDGCSWITTKSGPVFTVLMGQAAIDGVLGQLYRAGMRFHPYALGDIIEAGGVFAHWVASTFLMELGCFQPHISDTPRARQFFDTVATLTKQHTQTPCKFAKRKRSCSE